MNRNQLRARKAFERKHAHHIATQCAAVSFDLNTEGRYIKVTNQIAVQTLCKAFERHLRLQEDITFIRLTDAQSEAFPASGEIASGTVSVIAVTRDSEGDLTYVIERCSGGNGNGRELLQAAKRAAGRKLGASF